MSQVGTVHTADLSSYIAKVDELGGLGTEASRAYLYDFQLEFTTHVDPSLDPYSPEYFAQMLALYTEITGRTLNQEEGEKTHFPLDDHAAAVNPYSRTDPAFLAAHARTINTVLQLGELPATPTVLDMGCGWGLSSEVLAYSGAHVTAVDINAPFVELVNRRAARLNLPIHAVRAAFDDFTTDKRFDLILFYECLHHAVRPWETIERMAGFLNPTGRIMFAGEPVQTHWWKHWGLRLDSDSVYCMRKYGWWESGFGPEFLAGCFARAGLMLSIIPEIGLFRSDIGFAVRAEQAGQLKPNALLQEDNARFAAATQRQHELNLEVRLLKAEVVQQTQAHDNALALAQQYRSEHHALSQTHHQLAQQHHSLAENTHVLSQQHHALTQQHHELNGQHHDFTQTAHAEIARQKQAHDNALAQQQSTQKHLEAQIAAQEQTQTRLDERTAEHVESLSHARTLQENLDRMQQSWSWKLTAPLRWAGGLFHREQVPPHGA